MQLKRYRESLPNLILTDHLEFRWYAEGELRLIARLGHIASQDRSAADEAGASKVAELFDAFFAADLPSIGRPRELAERMAAKARLLRDSIELILVQEADSPLHGLFAGYREVLIADLSEPDFADLQAQTAAYGLFAARCRHEPANGPFTRQSAAFAETTPFLRDVFGRIAGPGMDERIAWIVDDLAYLLDRADMASILSEFGKKTRGEDPVVHFYEDFLAAYDPDLREMRGVYYTPEPVVSYIVRSVDHLLCTRFGLADGLADTATVTSQNGGAPHPRVLILDPAAGTGTFLREVVSTIRETIESKGLGGAWPSYVHEHLLPRLFGFELLMAPYSICHLKLALEIGGIDRGFAMPAGERLNVFLTNALEGPDEGHSSPLFAPEIVREATSAYEVKQEKPVMVVIGNPPYSGHSANKGAWIAELISIYKRGFPELKKPAQAKWLSDDYVKFIRFAQWRIEHTGEGVLGFVTNCAALFEALTALGKRLTALHLMETDEGEAPVFPVTEDNRVEKVSYAPSQKRVWINGKQYFDGVVQQTWEFTIGGYQPAEKWLKDRKKRTLSYDDISHYRRLCAALAETPRIMAKIDKTIDAYGGWPLVQDDYLRGLYQTMREEWTSRRFTGNELASLKDSELL